MTSHRTIRSLVAVAATAVAVSLPASAQATSLLSGYGGPGQGNQAILGSGLLNTPKGGGTSTGGGSLSEGSASGVGSASAKAGGSPSAKGRHSTSGGAGRHSGRTAAGTAPGSAPYASLAYLQRSRSTSAGTSLLGLTGVELLITILALIALALIGSLTLRLARDGRHTGTGPKGIPAGTRVTE